MSSEFGNKVKVSLFGESHGTGIGVVLDGLPAGEQIDWEGIEQQMARRAPGYDRSGTPRRESDRPEVLSGVLHDRTTGAPLCAVIRNENTRSGDYAQFGRVPRPGHADYTAAVKYRGYQDIRGGGHFSGRLTAPLVFAGAVCRQILERRGIVIGGHVYAVGAVEDIPFDPVAVSADQLKVLSERRFPVVSVEREERMRAEIEAARLAGDSVGGIVEVAAVGVPAGIGSPMFDGLENVLASIIFGIPAVKGVEFGAGFAAARQRGSEHNDAFLISDEGEVVTQTNRHGGILGGISSGMPIIVRAAFKPTPSIALPQQSVDLESREVTQIAVRGRHDPCIVPRAVPVVEAAVAIALIQPAG